MQAISRLGTPELKSWTLSKLLIILLLSAYHFSMWRFHDLTGICERVPARTAAWVGFQGLLTKF